MLLIKTKWFSWFRKILNVRPPCTSTPSHMYNIHATRTSMSKMCHPQIGLTGRIYLNVSSIQLVFLCTLNEPGSRGFFYYSPISSSINVLMHPAKRLNCLRYDSNTVTETRCTPKSRCYSKRWNILNPWPESNNSPSPLLHSEEIFLFFKLFSV